MLICDSKGRFHVYIYMRERIEIEFTRTCSNKQKSLATNREINRKRKSSWIYQRTYAYVNVLIEGKVNSDICWPYKVSLVVAKKEEYWEVHDSRRYVEKHNFVSTNCRTLVLSGRRRISKSSSYKHGHSYLHFISLVRTQTVKRWINRLDTKMHFHFSIS